MCVKLGLSLREECRLRVFERRMLKGIFRPQRGGTTGEECVMGNFIIGTLH
jgi:hypothetical protein